MTHDPTLLWLILLPALGSILCLFSPDKVVKPVALILSLMGFVLVVQVWNWFETGPGMQMAYIVPWISMYRIHFALGLDGLSLPLVALTKLMVPIAILASWDEKRHSRAFMFCYLLLDASMTGTFLATDIFVFYLFWEIMLIPMILIIGVWGGAERIYASLKFFLFTFAGSIFMLVAILWVFSAHHDQHGYYSAEIISFSNLTFSQAPMFLGFNSGELVFLAFFLAFAIKIPLFPLHTWLPDAHVQAPTGGSVLLAAVLLKMGIYGLLRFCIPICPEAFVSFTPILMFLSVVGIFYGAWVAVQQTDVKKLVAYSSISHLGFVVLGICAMNSEALTGAVLQMINHGISTGALFLLVGMLYHRRHSRQFSDFGGLAKQLPCFAFFLVFAACSSMGVPGLNGFVGEFLILLGTFKANPYWGGLATLGVIFAAIYTLIMLRKVLFGPITSEENKKLKDMNGIDWAAMVPLAIMIIWLGIYPQFFVGKFQHSLETYWSRNLPRRVVVEKPEFDKIAAIQNEEES